MSKSKFIAGDKVIITNHGSDHFGDTGVVTYATRVCNCKNKSRLMYTVSIDGKNSLANFYSYELKFADLHALADHFRKDIIASEKFHIGDIIRLVGTEKVGYVTEIIKPRWSYEIFTDRYQICNLYAIEHASESDLLAYQRILCSNADMPKAIKCKYCGEPFNEDNFESSEEPGACEYCVDKRKKMSKIHMRKSVAVDIKDFSIYGKDGDWLEVTEWTNGEGIDIDIHYSSDHEEDIRNFKLSYDELGIIINIVNKFGHLHTIYTTEEKEN